MAHRRLARSVCAATLAFAAALACTPVLAQSTAVFDVPRLPLSQALPMFGRQAGVQVLAPGDVNAVWTTPALRGRDTVRGALARLIAGSGLEIASDDGRIILLRRAASIAPAMRLIDGEPALLEEVVVTALRRETSASRTPISLIAIDADAVGSNSSLSQLSVLAPALAQTEVNTGQRRLSLRGMQSAGENTVALYVGETPVSGPNSATSDPSAITPDLDLYDLERIEILKGPQGSLFGGGAMSGAVRLLYATPVIGETAADMQTSLSWLEGGGQGGGLHAMANLPLGEDLALRVVGWSETRPGYVDNVRLGDADVNAVETEGFRASAAWSPRDGTLLTGVVMAQDQMVRDSSLVNPAVGSRRSDAYADLPFPNRFDLASLQIRQDSGIGRITANVAAYEWRSTKFIDTSLGALLARREGLYCPRYNGISTPCDASQLAVYQAYIDGVMPVVGRQPMEVQASVAEIRIDSNPGSPLGWTFGAFYEDRRDRSVSTTVLAEADTGEPVTPLIPIFQRSSGVDLEQTAIFGELAYSPIPDLTFRVGGRRYGYDKISRNQVQITSYINASVAGPETRHRSVASGWVSTASASLRLGEHAMVFAQYAEGFRPGGVNNTPGLAAEFVGYSADRARNFELGAKTTAHDGRLFVDLALFQVIWSDMQVAARIPNFNLIANAGEATIRGVEMEGQWRAGEAWTVRWSASLIDARLSDVATGARFDLTGKVGDRIPYEPDVRLSASIERRWTLPGEQSVAVSLEGAYSGDRGTLFDRGDLNYEKIGGSGVVNLGFVWTASNWEITARIENILDDASAQWTASRPEYERLSIERRPREATLAFRRQW